MESQFKDLAVLTDRVNLVQPTKGFLVVKKDFQLLDECYIDLGFRCQSTFHRSDDFYSIPLIFSDYSISNPSYEKDTANAFDKIKQHLLEQGLNIEVNGEYRYLLWAYGPEEVWSYLLYKSCPDSGKRIRESYFGADSREVNKEIPGTFGRISETIQYYERITPPSKRFSSS